VENAALQIASSLMCTIVWPASWLIYALASYADRTKMATRPVRAEVAMILRHNGRRAKSCPPSARLGDQQVVMRTDSMRLRAAPA